MPYKSDSQRRWAHTKAGEEALGGKKAVHEWDEATKGKDLPEKVSKSEMKKFGGMMQLSVSKGAKAQAPAPRMPKAKKMPGAFDKPSKFFKSEEFNSVKHPSVRKLLDFIQKKHKARQSQRSIRGLNMAEEKKYTAREAAVAVLAKAQEMLMKTELAKALDPKAGLGKPAHPSPAPMLALSEKLDKAENPDEKQDAQLGEDVEHLCEDHMLANKAAERKEGHKIVAKSECMKCNLVKPSPATGQGDTLKPTKAQDAWSMDKSEKMHKDTVGATAANPVSRMDAGFGKVIVKAEDEVVGSKKIGYKPSKLGAEEKDQEMPSDKAFEVEGKDHKSSDDERMGNTNDPDKDPKEHAEGNNAEPGSKPSVEANESQDTAPIKGHLKLAKFIGRMEHKRSMAKSEMEKAGRMYEKWEHKDSPTGPTGYRNRNKSSDMSGGQRKGPQGYPKYQEQAQNEKGIHTPVSGVTAFPKGKGQSEAGSLATETWGGKPHKELREHGKQKHKEKLAEMKAMPKPKLPR